MTSKMLIMIWLPVLTLLVDVYLISYGIIYKRRGLIAAGLSMFVALAAVAAVAFVDQIPIAMTRTESGAYIVDASGERLSTIRTADSWPMAPNFFAPNGIYVSPGRIVLLVIVGWILVRLITRPARNAESRACQSGWGLGRFILIVLLITFAMRTWSSSQEHGARDSERRERDRVAQAKLTAERAQKRAAMAATQSPLAVQTTLEQLWDRIDRPKIDLHSVDGTRVTVGPTAVIVDGAKIDPTSGHVAVASDAGHDSSSSLANTAAEIGRLLADVSAVAQHVSDGTRIVARTLLAAEEPAADHVAVPAPVAATAPAQPAKPVAAKAVGERNAVAEADASATAAATTSAPAGGHAHADTPELNERIGGELPADKPRPAWVDEHQKKVGNEVREVVVAGPYATPEECYTKTDELLKTAVYDYAATSFAHASNDELLAAVHDGDASGRASNLKLMAVEKMGIDLAYIRREIAKDEYLETVGHSVGPMKNLYTLLAFSPDVERELKVRWFDAQREARLTIIGLLSGSVLGVMGLAFSLLKIDTATKGYYSKRLFLGVPAAIIGLAALVAVFGRW
jgi:hypothetical protein